jgi:hypothetical protein
MNAWSEGGRVVADVCRYAQLPLFDEGKRAEGMQDLTAKLTRWTLDLASGTVKEEALDDAASEFPRLDERRAGLLSAWPCRHPPQRWIVGAGRQHLPLGSRDREAADTWCRRTTWWASDLGSRRAGAGEGDGFRWSSSNAERRSAAICWC